jgi:hypothetical protein
LEAEEVLNRVPVVLVSVTSVKRTGAYDEGVQLPSGQITALFDEVERDH